MKSHRQELTFETPTRRALLNITPQVAQVVRGSGVAEGLCLVNAMHITASVFINDDEAGLHRDFERWLEKLAPEKPHTQYDHNGSARTMPMRISSARSWDARSSWRSPPAGSISGRGSRFSTASSTAAGQSAC